jgi:hypothetical protein
MFQLKKMFPNTGVHVRHCEVDGLLTLRSDGQIDDSHVSFLKRFQIAFFQKIVILLFSSISKKDFLCFQVRMKDCLKYFFVECLCKYEFQVML